MRIILDNGQLIKENATVRDMKGLTNSSIPGGVSLPLTVGTHTLLDTEPSTKPTGYRVAEITPIVIDSVWTTQYSSRDATQDELDADYQNSVPTKISMRQARLVLSANSLLTTVTNAINASGDDAMIIEWEYATEVERNWTSLVALTASLGMSATDVDNLFIAGNEL